MRLNFVFLTIALACLCISYGQAQSNAMETNRVGKPLSRRSQHVKNARKLGVYTRQYPEIQNLTLLQKITFLRHRNLQRKM